MSDSTSAEADRQQRIDRALAEYYRRLDAGETVDREQFLAEHDDIADELAQCLAAGTMIEQIVSTSQPGSSLSGLRGLSGNGSSSSPSSHPSTVTSSVVEEAAGPVPLANYLENLCRSELLSKPDVAALAKPFIDAGDKHADRFARALIEAGKITAWQHEQIAAGRTKIFQLGKYRLLDLLGAGGMGSVFLAEHRQMKRQVAVKILPQSLAKKPDLVKRFHREARAVAALDHPNIVQAYNIDNEGDLHYLVMEYVAGPNLQQVVREEGPLSFERAAYYIREAASGLAHAHRRGVIHRDIKPGNLIDADGTLKIVDMGLARYDKHEEHALTKPNRNTLLGTADFVAPEQAVDSHDVDHRADLYSLGCSLYYLLTGRPPFPEGSLAERLMKHYSQEPPSIYGERPDAPELLVGICSKMMAKHPDDRYQTADELVEALDRFLEADEGEQAGHPVDWEPRPLPPRRKPGLSHIPHFAAGLTAGGLLVWLMLSLFSSAPEPEQSPPEPKVVSTSSAEYAALVLRDEPVAYWRLNDAVGETVRNYVPHKRRRWLEGTLHGDVRLQVLPEPPLGRHHPPQTVAAFDGEGDYVAVEDPGEKSVLDFTAGDEITLEAWANPTAIIPNDSQVYIVGKGRVTPEGSRANNQNWSLRLRATGDMFRISFLFREADTDDLHRWTSTEGIRVASGWHHVVVSYRFGDGESIRGFIDGKETIGWWGIGGASDASPVVDDAPVWIGSSMGGKRGSSFPGLLAEVAVYRKILPQAALVDHYRALVPLAEAAGPEGEK